MIIKEKIIHRFVKPISMYEAGGEFETQIIPLDTQAWAVYPEDPSNPNAKSGLFFVLGDGQHTYVHIRDGKSLQPSSKEYYAATYTEFASIVRDENYVHTDNNFTNELRLKLEELSTQEELEEKQAELEAAIDTKQNRLDAYQIDNLASIPEKADILALDAEIATRAEEDAKLTEAVNKKQDKLVAGQNISIVDNVISSTADTNLIYKLDFNEHDLHGDELTVKHNLNSKDVFVSVYDSVTAVDEWDVETYGELVIPDKIIIKNEHEVIVKLSSFVNLEGQWKVLVTGGSTNAQLGNYPTKGEVEAALEKKQNVLTAGANVEIKDDIISVNGASSIGLYVFDIENGNLVLEYQDGLTPPKYEINENGELVAEIE